MTDFHTATAGELLQALNSEDPDQIVGATQEFASRGDSTGSARLHELLRSSEDANVRNAVALALSDLNDPRAFDAIVELIKDERTRNSRGTLLYALGAYDCSSILSMLIDLVVQGNYEVSRQSLSLISGINTEVEPLVLSAYAHQVDEALATASEERRPLLEHLRELLSED